MRKCRLFYLGDPTYTNLHLYLERIYYFHLSTMPPVIIVLLKLLPERDTQAVL
jgi:hypothetical protein